MTLCLLNVEETRHYLGDISDAMLRRLVEQGHLCPVRLSSVRREGESGRRLLFFDVVDLDLFIERCKSGSTAKPNGLDLDAGEEAGKTMSDDDYIVGEKGTTVSGDDYMVLYEKSLNDREVEILRRRYGIGCSKETMSAIAMTLGISKCRVWQLEQKALGKLYGFPPKPKPERAQSRQKRHTLEQAKEIQFLARRPWLRPEVTL